jgi:Bacterial Ig domain
MSNSLSIHEDHAMSDVIDPVAPVEPVLVEHPYDGRPTPEYTEPVADRDPFAPIDLTVPYQTPTEIDLPPSDHETYPVKGAGAAHGTAEFVDGTFLYVPNDGFFGKDRIRVYGLDPDGRGEVIVNVTVPEPTDDERIASDKRLSEHRARLHEARTKESAGPFTPEQWQHLTKWVRRELHLASSYHSAHDREKLNP